jgi:hypothetical protein
MLLDDHAIVPLYFMTNKHLVSGRISGFLPNALDRHRSRFIEPRDRADTAVSLRTPRP